LCALIFKVKKKKKGGGCWQLTAVHINDYDPLEKIIAHLKQQINKRKCTIRCTWQGNECIGLTSHFGFALVHA
jgi:hypothetical protein